MLVRPWKKISTGSSPSPPLARKEAADIRRIVAQVCTAKCLEACPSVSAVYLSGSLARGDWVAGFSDVDLVVLGERVHVGDVQRLKKLLEETLGGVSVSIVPRDLAGADRIETYLLACDSSLLVGEDLLGHPARPGEAEIREHGRMLLKQQIEDWIRFRDSRKDSERSEDASSTVYMVLKLGQAALLSRGRICFGSKEILNEFRQHFAGDLVSYVKEAYELRSHWPDVRTDRKRLQAFSKGAVRFAYLLKKELEHKEVLP